jgi:cysteine-rich repeat protein
MKQFIMIVACMPAAFSLGACRWGIETEGDAEQDPDVTTDGNIDTRVDADMPGEADLVRPDAGDPDMAEPDAIGPDLTETVEPDVPPEVEDEAGSLCGNSTREGAEECDDGNRDNTDACLNDCTDAGCGDGFVWAGVEECDDTSGFCTGCALEPPAGWVECTDSSGATAFLLIADLPGTNDFQDYRDYCQTTIEAENPQDYDFYGLAVFSDQAVWDCISPSLDPSAMYYIGLVQNPGGPEPDGGWYWTGYDGTSWNDLGSYSASNPYLPGSLDDGGGTTGDAECGRLTHQTSGWQFGDYGCTTATNWNGICMIQF